MRRTLEIERPAVEDDKLRGVKGRMLGAHLKISGCRRETSELKYALALLEKMRQGIGGIDGGICTHLGGVTGERRGHVRERLSVTRRAGGIKWTPAHNLKEEGYFSVFKWGSTYLFSLTICIDGVVNMR